MNRRTAMLAVVTFVALLVIAGCGGNPESEEETGEALPATDAGGGDAAVGCSSPVFSDETPEDISTEALPVRNLTINAGSGAVEMRVEIADDTREMSQGLMFRESLGEGCGMLFVYPSERELSFWMRNTLIPLSIAYIDSEGEIIDLQDMEALDDEPPNYASAEPAQYALEANVGFFEENGVEVGDTVEIPGS